MYIYTVHVRTTGIGMIRDTSPSQNQRKGVLQSNNNNANRPVSASQKRAQAPGPPIALKESLSLTAPQNQRKSMSSKKRNTGGSLNKGSKSGTSHSNNNNNNNSNSNSNSNSGGNGLNSNSSSSQSTPANRRSYPLEQAAAVAAQQHQLKQMQQHAAMSALSQGQGQGQGQEMYGGGGGGEVYVYGNSPNLNDDANDVNDVILQTTPSKILSLPINVQEVAYSSVVHPNNNWISGGESGGVKMLGPDIRERISIISAKNNNNNNLNKKSSSSSSSSSSSKNRPSTAVDSSSLSRREAYGGGTSGSSSKGGNKPSRPQSSPQKALRTSVSKKSLEALSFINLTKGYEHGAARAESQILRIAMRDATINGGELVKLAAVKICIWWFHQGPVWALKKRKANTRMVKGLVIEIANKSILAVLSSARRKAHLLRNGCALTIQKLLKYWFYITRARSLPHGVGGGEEKGDICIEIVMVILLILVLLVYQIIVAFRRRA